ncbi:hypothetical protein GEMRC1_011330 [Eukaryota sp. GEM-RC1]
MCTLSKAIDSLWAYFRSTKTCDPATLSRYCRRILILRQRDEVLFHSLMLYLGRLKCSQRPRKQAALTFIKCEFKGNLVDDL